MARDGKDKFYRTLNLDNDTRKLIKWYHEVKQKMINNPDTKEIKDEDGK